MAWKLSLAIAAILVLATQSADPRAGDECVPSRDSDPYDTKDDDCTFFWKCALNKVTNKYVWTESKCVDGLIFNTVSHICEQPMTETKCQGYQEVKVKPTERAILPGCERSFICPADLQFFIYPDWNQCANYYTCQQGTIASDNCLRYGFLYFNPSTFACENTIDPQNACFNRL